MAKKGWVKEKVEKAKKQGFAAGAGTKAKEWKDAGLVRRILGPKPRPKG